MKSLQGRPELGPHLILLLQLEPAPSRMTPPKSLPPHLLPALSLAPPPGPAHPWDLEDISQNVFKIARTCPVDPPPPVGTCFSSMTPPLINPQLCPQAPPPTLTSDLPKLRTMFPRVNTTVGGKTPPTGRTSSSSLLSKCAHNPRLLGGAVLRNTILCVQYCTLLRKHRWLDKLSA